MRLLVAKPARIAVPLFLAGAFVDITMTYRVLGPGPARGGVEELTELGKEVMVRYGYWWPAVAILINLAVLGLLLAASEIYLRLVGLNRRASLIVIVLVGLTRWLPVVQGAYLKFTGRDLPLTTEAVRRVSPYSIELTLVVTALFLIHAWRRGVEKKYVLLGALFLLVPVLLIVLY